jgi:DNA-binding GntR family transcriptional regulator
MEAPDAPGTVASGAGPTVAGRLLEQLQDAIVRGDLQPGAKLSEPELARRHGVSRGPLREALRHLEARKLLQWEPRVGARVTRLSLEQLRDIYEVRELLEGMACRLAATRLSPREVDELRALLDAHEQQAELQAGIAYFQHEGDLDFHFRIVSACGNGMIRQILCEDLYQLMRLYRYKFSAFEGRPRAALEEHRRILAALAERDGEIAELMMRRHIAGARELIEARLAARTEEDPNP